MIALAVLLAVLVVAACWRLFPLFLYPSRAAKAPVLWARAGDGWRLALTRFPAQGTPRRHPVLLCHGLSADRHTFDVDPEHSLARFLAAKGFEVFILELRGHGLSDRPSLFGPHRWGFGFDAYLKQDLPAAIRAVQDETRRAELHFVGHSMGGILLYAHLAGGGTRIRSGVAVGSGLDYGISDSGFRRLFPLRWALDYIPFFPFGWYAKLSAPLAGRFGSELDRFTAWPENIEGPVIRGFLSNGIQNVSSPVLEQFTGLFEPGGLRPREGGPAYLERLKGVDVPLLAVAGDEDRQCPPATARQPIEQGGAGERRLVFLGKDYGQPEHYGHMDLLLGKRVKTEVFPIIADWLVAHDGGVSATGSIPTETSAGR